MTQFEFIGVGISIVLALTIARLLDGLSESLDADRRYWVHTVWLFNKFLNVLLFWFGFWVYFRTESVNVAEFFLQMSVVIVLYLQVLLLLTKRPESVESWRTHFFVIRRRFFALNFLFAPIGLIVLHVVAEVSFPSRETFGYFLIAALSLTAMVSESARVQGSIAMLTTLNLLAGFGGLFLGAR